MSRNLSRNLSQHHAAVMTSFGLSPKCPNDTLTSFVTGYAAQNRRSHTLSHSLSKTSQLVTHPHENTRKHPPTRARQKDDEFSRTRGGGVGCLDLSSKEVEPMFREISRDMRRPRRRRWYWEIRIVLDSAEPLVDKELSVAERDDFIDVWGRLACGPPMILPVEGVRFVGRAVCGFARTKVGALWAAQVAKRRLRAEERSR